MNTKLLIAVIILSIILLICLLPGNVFIHLGNFMILIGIIGVLYGVSLLTMSVSLKMHANRVKGGGKHNGKKPILTIDEIPSTKKYDRRAGEWDYKTKPVKHRGQRKLLLSEIMFLTLHDPVNKFIVYAGSSPNHKLYALYELFPDATFILVDPRSITDKVDSRTFALKFDAETSKEKYILSKMSKNWSEIKESDYVDIIKKREYRGYVIKSEMTAELATTLSKLGSKNIYFISDIRTQINEENDFINDADILLNTAQQYVWLEKLRPDKFMLKARPPHWNFGIIDVPQTSDYKLYKTLTKHDPVADYKNGVFMQVDGKQYLQVWPKIRSIEHRIIGSASDGPKLVKQSDKANDIQNRFMSYHENYRDDDALEDYWLTEYSKKGIKNPLEIINHYCK